MPTGFLTIALVAYLNAAGVDRGQQTAKLISLALLPWSFKLIWGPIIDSYQLPALGLRRPWIVFAQLGMAATLLIASTSDSLTDPKTIGFLAWSCSSTTRSRRSRTSPPTPWRWTCCRRASAAA